MPDSPSPTASGAPCLSPVFPRRRPDAGRGVQLWLVPAEPHVRQRRDLRQLPRTAQPEAAGRGQRRLHPVPRTCEVRSAHASFPFAVLEGRRVRVLPYAGRHLHGRRSAPRSLLQRAAPRPRRHAWHARRLHCVPLRQAGKLGCGRTPKAAGPRTSGDSRPSPRLSRRRPRCDRCAEAFWPESPTILRSRRSRGRAPLPVPARWDWEPNVDLLAAFADRDPPCARPPPKHRGRARSTAHGGAARCSSA